VCLSISCRYEGGKKRFDSAIGAQFRMAELTEQRVEGFERLEVYHCQHCNGWHVGHRPKPVKELELIPDFKDSAGILHA
jgi:hypothetical protein